MRIAALYLLAALGITSCVYPNESENNEDTHSTSSDSVSSVSEPQIETQIDTIVERNNPNSLDLEKHQIFIDTTRQSKFYDNIKNWKPEASLKETIEDYKSYISDPSEFPKSEFKNFPTEWVVIKQFKGEFVIHSPCNGIGGRYIFSENSVDYYSLEPDTDLISSVEKVSKDHLILNLKVHSEKSEETQTAVFSIRKTRLKNIYLEKTVYDHTIGYRLVTPLSDIGQFNLLVENCIELVSSNLHFDQIDFEGIENDL